MADSVSDDDVFVMILAAPLALPLVAPVAFGAWDEGREWMIERGFIASADEADWAVPGWDGAGVSSAHLVLVVCVLVVIMVVGSLLTRKRRDKQIDTDG